MLTTLISLTFAVAIGLLYYCGEPVEYPIHSNGLILITGASSGIGRHAAEYLANKYPNYLILAGVRKPTDFQNVLLSNIPNIQPIIIDVTSFQSCREAISQINNIVNDKSLPFIGLVNNAGIARSMDLEHHPINDARTVFETNVFGVLTLTQMALPLLRKSHGRIIMISSVAGFFAKQSNGVYSASKFALEALSDTFRRELAPSKVSVSIIQPGYVRTSIGNNALRSMETLFNSTTAGTSFKRNAFSSKKLGGPLKNIQSGADPSCTSEAIEHALVSARPRTRYPVAGANGLSATIISWAVWIFSDRIEDFIIKRVV